uniref:Myb-like domain-containing protein n=1 Tax=Heliothis virescens TaxID=7102 RepID=A0A2A4J9F8_HELVI
MNHSAAKVGEIFREAGTAFSKLSEMTISLQPIEESPHGGKWTEEEVELLRGCVNRFAVELNKISQHIKNRTMYHLRRLLEMDSGAIQDTSSFPPRHNPSQAQPPRPPLSQVQPPRPPRPQVQLPTRHTSPTAEYLMPLTRYPLSPAEYVPPQAEYISRPAGYIPPPREYLPLLTDYVPPPAEYAPPRAEYILLPIEYIPPPAEYMPQLPEYIPLPMKCIPPLTKYIPQPEEHSPSPAEYIAPPVEYIPQPPECIPAPAEYTPSPAEYVPLASEYITPPPPPPRPSTPELTLNMYLQGFGDNDDDLLLSFNPEIVPLVPPEQIMQPDKIQEKSPFEFEDIQLDQINLDEIKLAIPNLLKALDESAMPSTSAQSDQNALPCSQDNRDKESVTANIGTLHAEPTATEGAFSSIRNETKSIYSSPTVSSVHALDTADLHSRKRPDQAKWDIFKTEAKIESVKTSPTPNRQFTWFKAGETSVHNSSYTGQIKITELASGHFKNVTRPTGSTRIEERPFKMFNVRRTETVTSATATKESTETKEENKVKEKFDFFKYTQAKREEQSDNWFNFRRALEKRDQDSQSKDSDQNKEGSPSGNKSEDNKSEDNKGEDNKTGGFFNFRQSAESRANSTVGSQGNPSSPWVMEVSDEASTPQPVKRCHTPLEVDEKATFLSIRADNKIAPFKPFNRAKQAEPVGARRSRRLSHTTAFTEYITASATESTSGRKRDQRANSKRGKATGDKGGQGTPAKRSRKNPSGPSAKALKNKKKPKTE